jgi:hypothetical protein
MTARKVERYNKDILPTHNPHLGLNSTVEWKTVGGHVYKGTVIDIDMNVAIVKCTDGVVRGVEVWY